MNVLYCKSAFRFSTPAIHPAQRSVSNKSCSTAKAVSSSAVGPCRSVELILNAVEELANVHLSNGFVIRRRDRLVGARDQRFIDGVVRADLVFRLLLDVLVNCDSPIHKRLLRQHDFENFLAIVEIDTVKVLSLDLLLCDDLYAVEHTQLGNVVEHLAAIVLFILYGVEAEVKLGEQLEALDVLELEHLDDVVEREVQEAETFDVLEPCQVPDVVLRQVELLQEGQVAEACNLANLVLAQVDFFQVQAVKVLDFLDLIHAKRERRQALVRFETLNLANLVVVEAQELQVRVEAHVLDHFYLVVRVVDDLEVRRRSEIKHLGDAIVARVQLDQVLDVAQV